MATNYPGAIDSFTNPTSGDTLDSPSHAAQHANINDAMVAVQTKLGVGSGTIGTWTTYTPTLTNWAASSVTARYTRINKTVFVRFDGTVSSVSGVPRVSLPSTAAVPFANGFGAWFLDSGSAYFQASTIGQSTYVEFLGINASTTYATWAITSATVPFTWAGGDAIFASFFYEEA